MTTTTEPLVVDADGKPTELTVDELWTELASLGVGGAVRELLNRECAQHNQLVERIVTAAGFRKNPGADALCQFLTQRRTAGMALATLAEGLNGEVVALRRVIELANTAINAAKPETTPAAVRGALSRVNTVAHQAGTAMANDRISEYRRLCGSSIAALGITS